MKHPLIIFGAEDYAKIVHDYFAEYTGYEPVAFTVDRDYVKEPTYLGLPLIPFEDLTEFYPPHDFHIHVACIYNDMNRLRQQKCAEAKLMGYDLASFVHPSVLIPKSATLGEHHFIFEDNTIQPYTTIGKNCILWSGNHIGHETIIGDNVFISSHVVLSGHCRIGNNCFIGVNSTLANATSVGDECWISHGSVLSGDIPEHSMVKPVVKSEVMPLNEQALARSLARKKK